MNTDEAIKYLNYSGPIWLRKIEFVKEEEKCDKPEKDDSLP